MSLNQRGEEFSPTWLTGDDLFIWTNPGYVIPTGSNIKLTYMNKINRIHW